MPIARALQFGSRSLDHELDQRFHVFAHARQVDEEHVDPHAVLAYVAAFREHPGLNA